MKTNLAKTTERFTLSHKLISSIEIGEFIDKYNSTFTRRSETHAGLSYMLLHLQDMILTPAWLM